MRRYSQVESEELIEMWLSKAAIRRPVLTVVSMIIVLVLGAVSLASLNMDLIPDINPPVGAVVASYPGAGPDEVLEKVTKPLEQRLGTLSGLKTIQTQTQEGLVLVLLEFSWSEDINDKQNDIISRINQVALPSDVDTPTFLKFDPSSFPIMQLSVTNGGDPEKLRTEVDDIVQSLTNLSGVASASESGLLEQQVKVELDPEEMDRLALTQSDIKDILEANNLSLPGGVVQDDENELTTRVLGEVPDVASLRDLPVTVDPVNGDEVTLADVADINVTTEDRTLITRTNEETSVNINVFKQSGENTAAVAAAVHEEINALQDELDADIITIFDQGEYIEQAVGSVSSALIGGGILAMLVLFFFLRSFKSPIMIGVAIPFSVIVTFVLLYFADFTLNIMTLGGLALGVGMLVDNAIVVIENTYRHLHMGKPPKQAAAEGAGEVAGAITASTLTTLSVFLPIVFVSGIVGTIFREFAFTISFSLLASLFVALTVVPVMAANILKQPRKNREKERQQSDFYQGFRSMVKWALNHRKTVVAIALILLIAGGAGIWSVGTEFLPTMDEGVFIAEVEMPPGTGLEKTDDVTAEIEAILAGEDDVQDFQTVIGTAEGEASLYGDSGRNIAQIYVSLVNQDQRVRSTTEVMNDLRSDMEKVNDDAEITLTEQSSFEAGGAPNTIGFLVSGDEHILNDNLDEITSKLEEMKNVTDVANSEVETQPELQVTVDREEARDNGLAPAQIVSAVSEATRGEVVTRVPDDDGQELDVLLRYDRSIMESPEALKDLRISGENGDVTLDEVAEVEVAEGPTTLTRHNLERAVEYTVQFKDTNFGQVEQEVKAELDDLDLPDELSVTFIGTSELLDDAMNDLTLAAALSVLFVFLVLAGQYESFKYPFVILFTMPLMVISVALALFVTQKPVGVTAMIGLIVLAGIVVNNAIVMVDYINRLKRAGWTTYDAIVEASAVRLRPILMTATTTILGLVPLSPGNGEGTEIQQPMAISLIGGLLSSTLLTLVVIPVVYSWFDRETRYSYTYHPARPPRQLPFVDTDGYTLPGNGHVEADDESDVPKQNDRGEERQQPLERTDLRSNEATSDREGDVTRGVPPTEDSSRDLPKDTSSSGSGNDQSNQTSTEKRASRSDGGQVDDLSQEEMFDLMSRMLEMAKKLPSRRDNNDEENGSERH